MNNRLKFIIVKNGLLFVNYKILMFMAPNTINILFLHEGNLSYLSKKPDFL